ncbi:unnamed protein product [Parascedosporium putredinis]|uniref:Uncharacterized protein n=1 Tax=Parascedosporium putredinis TaxID=1442378 RepID=A0A9P1MCW7_9PEZI|nr:unnamed protein product [Parascedosporium putredinis]CAI7998568.1 unnamed protein product [Parascedosporium putredinis]
MATTSADEPPPLEAKTRRRGFVRPQGTDFAASARSRETGQEEEAAGNARSGRSRVHPGLPTFTDAYSPLAGSPDLSAANFGPGHFTESPIDEGPMDPDDYYDDFEEPDPNILPPTVSTYNKVEKPVARPPTIDELKSDLKGASSELTSPFDSPRPKTSQGWFEVQGMHILDVMTFAIRAAKMYYTAHEKPDRLDTIKPEKEVRADLLTVMDVLKHAATRDFAGGIRNDEVAYMEAWLNGVSTMLQRDEAIEDAEQQERASWSWLHGDWAEGDVSRELAFLRSMDPEADPLPAYTPARDAADLPTPLLREMQNGLRLVKLHNAAVHKSQRRFGAIPTFHTDTQKPYRAADNIRYWAKAAELRWEVALKVDALGIVYNNSPQVWIDFEDAIFKWCQKVREEISSELAQNTV